MAIEELLHEVLRYSISRLCVAAISLPVVKRHYSISMQLMG